MTVARESLRQRMARGDGMVGTFGVIPSPDVVELVALAGFDFVILDMEHGPFGLASLRSCLMAAHVRGMPALVRVRAAEPSLIGGVLDLGADGVLIPQVSSAAVAGEVARAARFAPEGARGANPWVRAAGYAGAPGWFAAANRDVAVLVMIEGVAGLESVGAILEVPGIDGLFLGPVDMSHSLGVPGQTDHPEVVAALRRVARQAAERDVVTAVFAPDPGRARSWRAHGVRVVACGVDTGLIRSGLAAVARAARTDHG